MMTAFTHSLYNMLGKMAFITHYMGVKHLFEAIFGHEWKIWTRDAYAHCKIWFLLLTRFSGVTYFGA